MKIPLLLEKMMFGFVESQVLFVCNELKLFDYLIDMCFSLIQRVYDKLPNNGLIVILEKLFDDDKSGPYLTAMLNLTMLLEMHGKHRSASEYLKWLQKVGFSDSQVIYSSGEKHMIIGIKKMREAILNLEKLIIRTTLIPFHTADLDIQSCIYLKPENLQIFGSYKIRGIVSVLKESDLHFLQSGLAEASAGNMAQAIAFTAQQLKIPCRIYVPESAPQTKLLAIQKLGAEIIRLQYEDVWKIVRGDIELPDDRIFIHPALNASLLKGYSIIAHEIIEDMPDADAVVIPFGVGGFKSWYWQCNTSDQASSCNLYVRAGNSFAVKNIFAIRQAYLYSSYTFFC